MAWPLRQFSEVPLAPHPGSFGAVRKYDIHTGVDLYCPEGTEVLAAEPGVVLRIEPFTGTAAGSPWWHDTMAALIEGASGVLVYGEIEPRPDLVPGLEVEEGQVLGVVRTVLRKDKGLPMTMLHFELFEKGYRGDTQWWRHGESQPSGLLDPTSLLLRLRGQSP